MTSPSTSFGLKAFGVIAAGLTVFVTIAWLTAKYTTPYAPLVQTGGAAVARIPTVAVLPLVNVSGDSTQAAIATLMTDSLAAALGRVPEFRVSPRQAAADIKDVPELNVEQVGAMLGVATLLRGTVRRDGGQLQIDLRLTDAKSGREMWTHRYERDTAAMSSMHIDMVRDASAQLAPNLGAKAP